MRAVSKALALAFALTACLSGCATSLTATQGPAVQLRQQADAWDRAIVRKDVIAIGQNMAASFRQIDSQGNLSNKAEFLSGITSDKLVIHPYQPEDVEIRFYGNLAIVTGTTHLHGTYAGKPF